jgi:hypothetical protein
MTDIDRRAFFFRTAGLVALGVVGRRPWVYALNGAGVTDPTVTVYKSSTCGCCAKWIDHFTANRFKMVIHDRDNMDEVKDWLGVPRGVRSCHTAQVDGYLIEGHVPASDVRTLLAKRPKIAGLAVPGMPSGTPGMAMPGDRAESYAVVAFQKDGTTKLFARH